MSYRGFGMVSEGFETFNQRVKVVGIAREVDRGFVAFRRFVREFSLSGDESLIGEARKRQQTLAASIKQGINEIKNPERHKKMAELGEQFEHYGSGFDRLVVLKQEQNKLTKEVLDPLGLKSATEIEELQTAAVSKAGNSNTMIMAGEALKQLLLVRLNVNKLLGRHEQSSADGAEKALAALEDCHDGLWRWHCQNEEVRSSRVIVVASSSNRFASATPEAYHKPRRTMRTRSPAPSSTSRR